MSTPAIRRMRHAVARMEDCRSSCTEHAPPDPEPKSLCNVCGEPTDAGDDYCSSRCEAESDAAFDADRRAEEER